MLGSKIIYELIDRGALEWDGAVRGDALLLRLGNRIQEFSDEETIIDPLSTQSVASLYSKPIVDYQDYILGGKKAILAESYDPIILDSSLIGYIATLSHVARLGISIHISSPWVMPGWRGYLTFEINNRIDKQFILRPRMPIGKLILFRAEGSSVQESFYGTRGFLASAYPSEFGLKNVEVM